MSNTSVISRVRTLGQLLGTMFSGNRDIYATYGYAQTVTFEMMLRKYQRQDIAQRIVDTDPKAIWTDPPRPVSSLSEEYRNAWQNVFRRHNLFDTFYRADKLAGLGRFSIILFGFDDVQSTEDLAKPVQPGPRKLLYTQPYGEDVVTISALDGDPSSSNYGSPALYKISPSLHASDTLLDSSITSKIKAKTFEVHASRVIHVAENTLEDSFYGQPRLLRVYNLLEDLQKVVGGSAETFWLTSNRGLHVDVDKEMDFTTDDAANLADEIDEYMHELRRVIRTKGVSVKPLGSDVADPQGPFRVITAVLAAATGIPQRILLGAESGQLASAQDRANWARRVDERRVLFAEPVILRPATSLLESVGLLPQLPDNTAIEFRWPDAFKQNPLEIAQTGAQRARSLTNTTRALESPNSPISIVEARKILQLEDLGLDPEEVPEGPAFKTIDRNQKPVLPR